MSRFKSLTYRENYEAAMEYLSSAETKHAPKFDLVKAPEDLQELMKMAYMPRGEERSKWLNDFVERCWAISWLKVFQLKHQHEKDNTYSVSL